MVTYTYLMTKFEKKSTCLKLTYELFGQEFRLFSILYLTVSGIIINTVFTCLY